MNEKRLCVWLFPELKTQNSFFKKGIKTTTFREHVHVFIQDELHLEVFFVFLTMNLIW